MKRLKGLFFRPPTLRRRIVSALAMVVALSIFLTAGVAYFSTSSEFSDHSQESSQLISEEVSVYLSEQLARNSDWSEIEPLAGIARVPQGFFFVEEEIIDVSQSGAFESVVDFDSADAEIGRMTEVIAASGIKGLNMRVDVGDGAYVYESMAGGVGAVAFLNAPSAPIFDYETGEEIGTVTVLVTDAYFGLQRVQFLDDLLASIFFGSIAVAIVTLLFGTWLAWRIAAPVTALTNASRALAEDGRTDYLPVTSADELGQMSATFNQMVDKLQTQRKLRKRLLSDVSHELNTPLSVIQLEAIGIKDGIQAPDDAADQIIYEIGMLRNLVYDLNWLSETDMGEVRLTKTQQTVKRLLSSEVERWQSQARSQQVRLTLQSLPNLPSVAIDELRMGQALGNLLSNALEHTPVGGEVTVSAELRPIHQATGMWLVISVQDSGEGIDSAELHHVFERFYRTDEARSRQQGGRGLGLSITRQLVQLHDGHVWAESTLGQGSTFFIALPVGELAPN